MLSRAAPLPRSVRLWWFGALLVGGVGTFQQAHLCEPQVDSTQVPFEPPVAVPPPVALPPVAVPPTEVPPVALPPLGVPPTAVPPVLVKPPVAPPVDPPPELGKPPLAPPVAGVPPDGVVPPVPGVVGVSVPLHAAPRNASEASKLRRMDLFMKRSC
jgi:hypothetical protein